MDECKNGWMDIHGSFQVSATHQQMFSLSTPSPTPLLFFSLSLSLSLSLSQHMYTPSMAQFIRTTHKHIHPSQHTCTHNRITIKTATCLSDNNFNAFSQCSWSTCAEYLINSKTAAALVSKHSAKHNAQRKRHGTTEAWSPSNEALSLLHSQSPESIIHCRPVALSNLRSYKNGVTSTNMHTRFFSVVNGIHVPNQLQILWFSIWYYTIIFGCKGVKINLAATRKAHTCTGTGICTGMLKTKMPKLYTIANSHSIAMATVERKWIAQV